MYTLCVVSPSYRYVYLMLWFMHSSNCSWLWRVSSAGSNHWEEKHIHWYTILDGSWGHCMWSGSHSYLWLQSKLFVIIKTVVRSYKQFMVIYLWKFLQPCLYYSRGFFSKSPIICWQRVHTHVYPHKCTYHTYRVTSGLWVLQLLRLQKESLVSIDDSCLVHFTVKPVW